MAQRPLQVAIVGAGLMGRWHAYYAPRAGAQVAAIVDARAEAAEALGRRCREAAAFPSLEAALGARPIDAVHICTGLASHARLAETALQAGKHVLVEKPVGRSLEETRRLVELAAANHLQLAVVHQFPFQRGVRWLLEQRGVMGEAVRVEFRTCSAGGEGKTAAQRRAVLLEILPHPLSLFRAALGQDVAGVQWHIQNYGDDDLVLAGRSGCVDLSIVISLRGRPTCNELTYTGTKGTGMADLFHGFAVMDRAEVSRSSKMLRPLRISGKGLWTAGTNLFGRAARREAAYPGLPELIYRFYDSIRYNAPPPVSPAEMLETAAFLDWVGGDGLLSAIS
jgi:predicted dehydrogenase